jgi:hypothetical protein
MNGSSNGVRGLVEERLMESGNVVYPLIEGRVLLPMVAVAGAVTGATVLVVLAEFNLLDPVLLPFRVGVSCCVLVELVWRWENMDEARFVDAVDDEAEFCLERAGDSPV